MPAKTHHHRGATGRPHHRAVQPLHNTAKAVEEASGSFGWGEGVRLALILVGLFNFDKAAEKHFQRSSPSDEASQEDSRQRRRRGSEISHGEHRRGSKAHDRDRSHRSDGDRSKDSSARDRTRSERSKDKDRHKGARPDSKRERLKRTWSHDLARAQASRERSEHQRRTRHSRTW